MSVTIITSHDRGCRFAREADGGHSEAARRLSDRYNLHKTCGIRSGWIAARFSDGGADDEAVYPDRREAVRGSRHNERWYAYVELSPPSMNVCQAASQLRFQAHTRKLSHPDRDERGGGLVVIPRLTIEDRERQIAAMQGRNGLAVALGRVK